MKKSILNLGKNLNKTEQQQINGGLEFPRKPDYCDEQTEISREDCLCYNFGICQNNN
jgi:hypothetical protein